MNNKYTKIVKVLSECDESILQKGSSKLQAISAIADLINPQSPLSNNIIKTILEYINKNKRMLIEEISNFKVKSGEGITDHASMLLD
jgi:hypothetical protein